SADSGPRRRLCRIGADMPGRGHPVGAREPGRAGSVQPDGLGHPDRRSALRRISGWLGSGRHSLDRHFRHHHLHARGDSRPLVVADHPAARPQLTPTFYAQLTCSSAPKPGKMPACRRGADMDLASFKTSIAHAKPPAKLDLALQALWWDAKGDWKEAHEHA